MANWSISYNSFDMLSLYRANVKKCFGRIDAEHLLLGRKAMTNLESILQSRDVTLLTKISTKLWFFQSHVWMWKLDHKESWAPKNLCFWTVVLEKTLESPSDCKEIKSVNPKGSNPKYSLEGLLLKLELLYFGLLVQRADSLEKNPDARKDWIQKEREVKENEMIR